MADLLNKIRRYISQRWQSLTFKILFYFGLTVFVIATVLGINFANRIKPHFNNELLPNLARYIEYVVSDVGAPPDLIKAQKLALELPFELRIEGDNVSWSSHPSILPIRRYRLKPAPKPYQMYLIGARRHHHFLVANKAGYQYLFRINRDFRKDQSRRHWLLFLVLGGTLLVLYFLIRRLFKPIQLISHQVDKMANGVFDQPIQSKGNDELSVLARGINTMSVQIKSMLDGKALLLLAISHELRSPITRMWVNLELLDKSSIRDALIDDVKEVEYLISNILESEKLSTGHAPLNRTQSHLKNLIDAVITQHFSQAHINLELSAVHAFVDELRFSLLIKNLLDNATRYSPSDAPAIDVKLSQQNQQAVITITDYGSGISAEDLKQITEPFYRVDSARQRSTGGYGLGLYLCQQIVKAHGGKLEIESELNVGTSITIYLPA